MTRRGSPTVLIATVGMSRGPVVASIKHHAPDAVIFLASRQSSATATAVAEELRDGLRTHVLLLDEPEELTSSYDIALQALTLTREWAAGSVIADLSGGTKPMVAGLTLALAGRNVMFSYVSGSKRDESGRVIDGSEVVMTLEDPTSRHATDER